MENKAQKMVLLVEDNQNEVMLTRRAFGKSGFRGELVTLEDGVEALNFLFGEGSYQGRDTLMQPAVFLMDINMPRLNGLEALERIRADERTRLIPVVMLTSSLEQEDLIKSYDLGANSYIRKPVSYDRFLAVVQELGLYWLELNEPPQSKL